MTNNKIEVSVVCNAYNHGKFIAKTLDGILMQKTTFSYEILVHDDASTDNTADIIKEYEKKYPKVIKPIYETDNLYSKDTKLLGKIQYGRALGKYIAICEGDDYWIDPRKLQKQYDALEKHPEIDICATAAYTDSNGNLVGVVSPSQTNTIIPVEQVILGGGGFVETATLFVRKQILSEPRNFLKHLRLDYSIQISGALRSGMLYLADKTAVYRLFSCDTSWSTRISGNTEKSSEHSRRVLEMLDLFNKETDYQYDNVIQKRKRRIRFDVEMIKGNYIKLLSKEYKSVFKEQRLVDKFKIIIKATKQSLT